MKANQWEHIIEKPDKQDKTKELQELTYQQQGNISYLEDELKKSNNRIKELEAACTVYLQLIRKQPNMENYSFNNAGCNLLNQMEKMRNIYNAAKLLEECNCWDFTIFCCDCDSDQPDHPACKICGEDNKYSVVKQFRQALSAYKE
jgi:hypothetical protein